MNSWLRPLSGGVELTVRLTPRATRDRVEGLQIGADDLTYLAARVRAVPEKGKANAALEELIADWIGAPKRTVTVTGGSTSRIKTVFIAGDPAMLEGLLAGLTQDKGYAG